MILRILSFTLEKVDYVGDLPTYDMESFFSYTFYPTFSAVAPFVPFKSFALCVIYPIFKWLISHLTFDLFSKLKFTAKLRRAFIFEMQRQRTSFTRITHFSVRLADRGTLSLYPYGHYSHVSRTITVSIHGGSNFLHVCLQGHIFRMQIHCLLWYTHSDQQNGGHAYHCAA